MKKNFFQNKNFTRLKNFANVNIRITWKWFNGWKDSTIKTVVVKLLIMIQKVDERVKLISVLLNKWSSLKYIILFLINHLHRNKNRDLRQLCQNNPLCLQSVIQNRISCPNHNPKKKNKKIVPLKVLVNNNKKYLHSIKKKQRPAILKRRKKNWKI